MFISNKGGFNLKIKWFFILFFAVFLLAACSSEKNHDMSGMNHEKMNEEEPSSKDTSSKQTNLIKTTKTKTLKGNEFTIVAKEATHKINGKTKVTAWTFNGSVPGSEIRVKEGEKVTIHFKNELPAPVSIHWHGIPVPNEMDGIPGVTQNAVKPGETFTYEFIASVPGTYMYHSHQDGVNQIDKGLYGAFIVEPKEKTYDKDYALVLDEWMSNPVATDSNGMMDNKDGMDHNMGDMHHEDKESEEMPGGHGSGMTMAHDMSMYDTFTINGKSGDAVAPIQVKKGERVRLRFINIGYLSHKIHLHGHTFQVVAVDGQELSAPKEIKDQLVSIAPGERYDIEFVANNPGQWYLECHGDLEGTPGMKALIQYDGVEKGNDKPNDQQNLPNFDFANYGKNKLGEFTLHQKYDVEYTMDLNTQMMGNGMVFTINGKTFPDTDNINVKTGDLVKVRLVNNSHKDGHPMHLHGHFFQVLSKNGKPISGSPIVKDTINLKPGEEYVVAFKADNPGNWLFHCHDLHHATAGMVNMVKYDGYKTKFKVDPNTENKPE